MDFYIKLLKRVISEKPTRNSFKEIYMKGLSEDTERYFKIRLFAKEYLLNIN